MKTFENYTYERPDLQEEKAKFEKLLQTFSSANSSEEATKAIEAINKFRNRLSTLFNLVYIRSSVDTNNEFYQKERDFFDEVEPEIKELNTDFYKELIQSPFRDELEKQWGSQLFQIAEFEIQAFSSEVISLLQRENKLSSEYAKLVASAEVEFNGKTYTLAQLGPFTQDRDRSIRKEAVNASAGFFSKVMLPNLMIFMTS